MRWIRNWLDRREARRKAERRLEGRLYAIVALHTGEETVASLVNHTEAARAFGTFDEFDEGVLAVCGMQTMPQPTQRAPGAGQR